MVLNQIMVSMLYSYYFVFQKIFLFMPQFLSDAEFDLIIIRNFFYNFLQKQNFFC